MDGGVVDHASSPNHSAALTSIIYTPSYRIGDERRPTDVNDVSLCVAVGGIL